MTTILTPQFKSKIAGYLSYPLRSSDISLLVAIHAKEYPFEFCFSSYRDPKQNHKDSIPYPVCSLRSPIKIFADKDAAWELNVRPVLRRHRKIISDIFLKEGFQKIEGWLSAPRTPVWFSTAHRLEIKYLPETQNLIITESC